MARRVGFIRGFVFRLLAPILVLTGAALASSAGAAEKKMSAEEVDAAHLAAYASERYPSATQCASCHPKHYRQWSISQHAYAQMSPIFNAMQAKIFKLTNGSNGDFCIRCHTQIGMNLGEPEFMSNIDRHPASREGVSCIVCHRINQPFGKISGRFPLVEGPVTAPVFGPTGPQHRVNEVIEKAGLTTDPSSPGRQIHGETQRLGQITTSAFCGTCHDVTLVNGFRLEEAFTEFKTAPAAQRGITCQDCHMGVEPGKIVVEKTDPDFERKNYDYGPAAKVGSLETAPRKLTNHMFVGPDYSVLPPSLFPLNARAIKEESQKNDPKAPGLATIREWLKFDHRAGWGTDDFEEGDAAEKTKFPDRWASVDDRYDARAIIDENEKLLEEMRKERLKFMRNGYVLGEVKTTKYGPGGIKFKVQVRNGTDGHNVPTGFDAERLVWLFVRVFDADGKLIKQSGDLDANGDVRDLHSLYVHNGELPLDTELFNLQTKFVTRNVLGGEREQVLAVNYSPSPLPFIRPSTQSTVLLSRPLGARKHQVTIEALGERWPEYAVSADQLTGRAPYKVRVQLKGAMVPVNLVNEIRDVGFDYNLSARDIADALVEEHVLVWDKEYVLGEDSAGRVAAQ